MVVYSGWQVPATIVHRLLRLILVMLAKSSRIAAYFAKTGKQPAAK